MHDLEVTDQTVEEVVTSGAGGPGNRQQFCGRMSCLLHNMHDGILHLLCVCTNLIAHTVIMPVMNELQKLTGDCCKTVYAMDMLLQVLHSASDCFFPDSLLLT